MEFWLPVFFCWAMGLSMLIYVILDGYDLGVGLLLPLADENEKDTMVASIGPFWDANETWIVLGVGILLTVFPKAHGMVLTALYIPVTIMLFGLILRGVAFDFRVKAQDSYKDMWNKLFFIGSLVASMAQGWMLGAFVTGLQTSTLSHIFSTLIALTLPMLYMMLGTAWLIIKTENKLQDKAFLWAKNVFFPMGIGLLLISIATPIVSQEIANKWFSMPNIIALSPIPFFTLVFYFSIFWLLKKSELLKNKYSWIFFLILVAICVLATIGLAYSIFPDIIIGKLSIWNAAASVGSLKFIFWGTLITLPLIIGYTIFIHIIFRGKASNLSYE